MHTFSAVICIYGIIISDKILTYKLRCTNKNKINWKIKNTERSYFAATLSQNVSMDLPAQ